MLAIGQRFCKAVDSFRSASITQFFVRRFAVLYPVDDGDIGKEGRVSQRDGIVVGNESFCKVTYGAGRA